MVGPLSPKVGSRVMVTTMWFSRYVAKNHLFSTAIMRWAAMEKIIIYGGFGSNVLPKFRWCISNTGAKIRIDNDTNHILVAFSRCTNTQWYCPGSGIAHTIRSNQVIMESLVQRKAIARYSRLPMIKTDQQWWWSKVNAITLSVG